jgi:hypothetical protein
MDSSNIVAVLDRFGREIFLRQPNPIAVTLRRATQALNCPLVNSADTNGCSCYTKVCGRCGGPRQNNPTVCELICFARKHNLDAQLRQINTTGKSLKTCPAIRVKIFR